MSDFVIVINLALDIIVVVLPESVYLIILHPQQILYLYFN